ncbi:MAG: VWA-like domain-containing protein [Gammaproteobacteria bacterium]|nr:VWA-like domain-containing protein [Gammaproteobacteria bacterium]
MAQDIETKLAAARTRLILDKPFLGALVLRLPMVEANPDWCKTTATDARKLYYNHDYINQLTLEECQFVLAHEALHCALSHFVRRQHRIKHRWDVACDYAINPLLIADGMKYPPNALYMPDYEGMTAEEIYPFIDEHNNDGPMDQHLYDDDSSDGDDKNEKNQDQDSQNKSDEHDSNQRDDTDQRDSDTPPQGEQDQPRQQQGQGQQQPDDNQRASGGNGQNEQRGRRHTPDGDTEHSSQPGQPDEQQRGAAKPPPLSQTEMESLAIQWQQRMAGAAQSAIQAGKMSGSMARMVDHLLQPQLPWRMLLSRYLSNVARDDYNFARPSNRREGDAILPSLHSSQVDVTVVLDTSGSIKDGEMKEFISEVNALKGQLRARVTLHACDDKLNVGGPWRYEPWEEISLPESLEGGGGTDFAPAFEWARQQDKQPDIMVYFTDADGHFPERAPDFPVLWLVKGKSKVPWGQRIQLNQ